MRKGSIFWRLMTFWREEIGLAQNRIGFWERGKRRKEEQGKESSLFFREKEKLPYLLLTAWMQSRETGETGYLWKQEQGQFAAAAQKKRKELPLWIGKEGMTEIRSKEKEPKGSLQRRLFGGMEVFEEKRGIEPFGNGQSNPLRQKETADLPSVRSPLLTVKRSLEPQPQQKQQEIWERAASKEVTAETEGQKGQRKDGKEAEQELERLMRQIARRLWEERESCGRRLYR